MFGNSTPCPTFPSLFDSSGFFLLQFFQETKNAVSLQSISFLFQISGRYFQSTHQKSCIRVQHKGFFMDKFDLQFFCLICRPDNHESGANRASWKTTHSTHDSHHNPSESTSTSKVPTNGGASRNRPWSPSNTNRDLRNPVPGGIGSSYRSQPYDYTTNQDGDNPSVYRLTHAPPSSSSHRSRNRSPGGRSRGRDVEDGRRGNGRSGRSKWDRHSGDRERKNDGDGDGTMEKYGKREEVRRGSGSRERKKVRSSVSPGKGSGNGEPARRKEVS